MDLFAMPVDEFKPVVRLKICYRNCPQGNFENHFHYNWPPYWLPHIVLKTQFDTGMSSLGIQ